MANKYLDNDGVLYFWNKIKAHVSTAVSGKVDKENGKGLSANDYTTAEKNKLNGIASGAQVNVIETVKVNGSALTVTSKAVDVSVPTKTSQLTNDSGYLTTGDIPEGAAASTTTPKMDGTAAVGTELAFARGDHVHPSDTKKLSIEDVTITNLTGDNAGLSVLYLGTDQNGNMKEAYYVNDSGAQAFKSALNGKVDAVSGKGLSTNDYTTAEKNKLAAFGSASTYALKSDITNMYKYKGSVATVSALPSSGQTAGDVYNVEATGMNYAWNGTEWDALGEIFTITAITNAEIDTIVAS